MTTFRPQWLPRRADPDTRMEFEDDTPADPTHTFGPTKHDIRFVRAIALYAIGFWVAIGGAALWCWPR